MRPVFEGQDRYGQAQLQCPLHRRDGRVWRALSDRGRRPRPARRPRVPPRPTPRRPDASVRLLAGGGRGGGCAIAPSRAAIGQASRCVNDPEIDIERTKEHQIVRDIATATLSGNLTREVELRPLPSGSEVARLRVVSGTRRRSGEEWIEKTNYFTVEVYGPQATCAPSASVKGRVSWSTANSIGGNGPTRKRTDARRSCSGHVRSCSSAPLRPLRRE